MNSNSGHLIREIFDKYALEPDRFHTGKRDRLLNKHSFVLMVIKLSRHLPEMEKVNIHTIEAVFSLMADRKGFLDYEGFERWWRSSDKFHYFYLDNGIQLTKAYVLYSKYVDESTAFGGGGGLTLENFTRMLGDLKLEGDDSDFDRLDTDDDGVLSFKEFYEWLGW
jgi:Ca2+-binding EF-hand superfamily protein